MCKKVKFDLCIISNEALDLFYSFFINLFLNLILDLRPITERNIRTEATFSDKICKNEMLQNWLQS